MARRHLPDMLVGKLLMLMMASLLARAALGLRVVVDVLVNLALRRLAGVIDWSSNGEKDVRRRHIGRGRRNGDRAGEAIEGCNKFFSRNDSLRRHLRDCCGEHNLFFGA